MWRAVTVCCALVVAAAHRGHDHNHDHGHGHDHGHDHGHTGQQIDTSKPPVTRAPVGEVFGAYMTSRRGRQFESYRGMRYAEPPVGELRFQPPKPMLRYKGVVNASDDGPACPLPAPPNYPVDEDCLTINVYTPLRSQRTKPLPVIFFIHPGGFYSMTGRSDLAGPHYLLDRDIVLVTINYRLGSLGFLSTGDELAPGNNGYKDQVVALRWVQRNIAAFGGDPNSVTITGCSAGSFSVMLHMISPMSKGLFHRGISMSGSPVGKVRLPHDLRSLAVKQAQLLNCPTDSSKSIIDCLKTKSWRELGDSLPGFFELGFDPVGLWLPIVENDFGQERFLPIEPMDAIREGKMHAVPYIISQTQDEFFWFAFTTTRNETLLKIRNTEWERTAPISFLLPPENSAAVSRAARKQYLYDEPLKNDSVSAARLGLLYADSIVGFVTHRLVKLMSKHSPKPVWYYQLGYLGNHSHYEDPITGKPTRPAHHDDLIYLFTLRYRFPDIGLEGEDAKMVDRMTALWYNFARYDDPNPRGDTPELGSLKWPPTKFEDRTYLRVDKEFTLHKNLNEDRYKFWEDLYPIEY